MRSALGLPTKAEKDEVVAREHRVHELRDDRFVVPDDAGKQPLAGLKFSNEVLADFFLDRPRARAGLLAKVAERLNGHHHEPILLH